MKPILSFLAGTLMVAAATQGLAANAFTVDTIRTGEGELKITFIGHATLFFSFNHQVVHVDPWSKLADYATLPKADIILLTHHHGDHLDPAAIQALKKEASRIVITRACQPTVPDGIVMSNGEAKTIEGLRIEAVPAYNLIHMRSPGQPYHPKGEGNGYVLTFADKRVYVAGDTENTPEMKQLKNIDVAFLPMNLPYTMTPEMVADAALAFKPKILYPYHFGETDTARLVSLLSGRPEIEVRIRRMP
jgi:L-ascorbate metabolism protein UlaG (beta-lactamase superfamily)